MADLTLSSGSVVKAHRTPWGAFHTRQYGVSTGISSAVIYAGRPVTLDYTLANPTTNASYVKGSTAPNSFYLVGIAAETTPSTALAGQPVHVYEANPMAEFSAVTKLGTLQSSQVGLTKKLDWDSTLNIAFVDLTASTATDHRVVITQLLDAVGDSGGRVAFRFISDARQQGSTVNSSTPYLAFYR